MNAFPYWYSCILFLLIWTFDDDEDSLYTRVLKDFAGDFLNSPQGMAKPKQVSHPLIIFNLLKPFDCWRFQMLLSNRGRGTSDLSDVLGFRRNI